MNALAELDDLPRPTTEQIEAMLEACYELTKGPNVKPNTKPAVIITVRGGVAEVQSCPAGIDVHILDYDNWLIRRKLESATQD